MAALITLTAQLTCPECNAVSAETMPTNACQYFYDCRACGAVLRPKPGDCCVFCSYADVCCPPKQDGESCGCVRAVTPAAIHPTPK